MAWNLVCSWPDLLGRASRNACKTTSLVFWNFPFLHKAVGCWPQILSMKWLIHCKYIYILYIYTNIILMCLQLWTTKGCFWPRRTFFEITGLHYNDVIMSPIASQFTSLTIVYSTVYSGADQRKHQSSASLAFVRGTHRWPVNSPHKGPITRKMFPFDDVIMELVAMRLPYVAFTFPSRIIGGVFKTSWLVVNL